MNCDNQCCENHHHTEQEDYYGINVTAMMHTQEPLLVHTAAALVPVSMRERGTRITFWTFTGWQTWQFQSMDVREWLLPEKWEWLNGEIKDGAITTSKIADGAVTEEKLSEGSVTMSKLADDVLDQVQSDWNQTDNSQPSYINNKPVIPSELSQLSDDSSHRTVTDEEKTTWNNKGTYSKPLAGIPATDLASSVQTSLRKANTAYQKPANGIPATDLASSVQTSLGKADTAYQKPVGGIPSSAMSSAVQASLRKADTAYQKPASGISISAMSPSVQASLNKADTAYQKPPTGIPASDIASGVIPDVSQFITRNVNNLVNYYLKSETYTQAEVQGLIAAINQFHYEIYPSTSAVTNPQGNVLYLIGPTGTGADKYEEYVYANNTWVKIGDTSIDLSGYVTTQALNAALASYSTTSQMNNAIAAALANYTTTADLNTLLAAKQDVLTFDNVPTAGSTNPVKSGGVYSSLEQLNAQIEAEQDSIQEEIVDIAKHVTFSSIPMLCGQPMILFGNGTPQESIVPINWIQFLDGGYNWTGLPSALGQVYINTAVNSGGRYTAVWNGNILKWVNS